MYNKLFDMLDGWDLLNDGEKVTRTLTDEKTSDTTNNNTTSNTLENNSTTENTTIADRRESDLPQSEIDNVQDGSYMTKYNLDKTTVNGTDNSNSSGTSTTNGSTNTNENVKTLEEISRTPADKISIYKQFQENLTSIYQMIFKELDDLFGKFFTTATSCPPQMLSLICTKQQAVFTAGLKKGRLINA